MSGNTPISGLTPTALLQGVASNAAPGGATNVPPGILALPSGTLLRGKITSLDTLGNAILNTAKGEVTLKTSLPLQRGNDVVIRLDTSSSGLSARVISVDGLTPKELQQHAQRAAGHPVEDIIDTPGQKTNVENKPAGTVEAGTRPAIPSVDVKLPQESLLRAVLLSRSTDLPLVLKQLPNSIALTPGRLDAGAHVTIKLLPHTVQLPTPGAQSATSFTSTVATALLGTQNPAPQTATPSATGYYPLPTANTAGTTAPAGTAPGQPATTAPTAGTPNTTTSTPGAPTASTPTAGTTPATTPLTAQPATTGTPTTPATSTAGGVTTANPTATSTTAPSAATTTTQTPATGTTTNTAAQNTATPTATPPTSPTPNAPASTTPAATAAATTPTQALQQGLLSAQVIGTEQSGETVVKTALGTIKLDLPMIAGERPTLPPGTQMSLQLVALEPAVTNAVATATNTSVPASLSELSTHWHALREAVEIIQQANPALGQQVVEQLIPQPGPKMAATTLFFVAALRGGDMKQWLGRPAMEALEQLQRGDLINRLTAEFATLRQFFAESPSPNWQAAFVPVNHGDEWQQARLFVRKDPEDGEKNGERIGTRFIMEVELSNFGAMQFDGFIRKQKQATQFDLIIRSYVALPAENRQGIRDIFSEASEITGFKGGISFQVGSPFPTNPMEEIIEHDRDVLA